MQGFRHLRNGQLHQQPMAQVRAPAPGPRQRRARAAGVCAIRPFRRKDRKPFALRKKVVALEEAFGEERARIQEAARKAALREEASREERRRSLLAASEMVNIVIWVTVLVAMCVRQPGHHFPLLGLAPAWGLVKSISNLVVLVGSFWGRELEEGAVRRG